MENLKVYFRYGYIADYFRYLFNYVGTGPVMVTRHNPVGVFVLGQRKYSDLPVKHKKPSGLLHEMQIKDSELPEEVEIAMPDKRTPRKFIHYTCADLLEINDITEVYFDIDFWRYYLHASKLKVAQKDILESYVLTRKLISIESDNEMLKKREYRDELKNLKMQAKMLKNKVDYINSNIKLEVEKYVKDKIYSQF